MSGTRLFSGGDTDMPTVAAQQPSRRAEPITTYRQGKDRQRQLAASMVTRDWDEPTLGEKGLTGL